MKSKNLCYWNRIGSLTEYFQLADVETVWDDLRQMQPKVLEPVELDVLF
jgi:hypothetical protein